MDFDESMGHRLPNTRETRLWARIKAWGTDYKIYVSVFDGLR